MTVIDGIPFTAPASDARATADPAYPRPDGEDRYTLGEVAEFTGLSEPTLAWYEQIGLLPASRARHNGRPGYGNRELDWLAFVETLLLAGMPVADIVRFADLVREGADTHAERRRILEQTRRELHTRIARLQDAAGSLDATIDRYDEADQPPAAS